MIIYRKGLKNGECMRKVFWAAAGCAAILGIAGCFYRQGSSLLAENQEQSERIELQIALQNEEGHPLCQGMKKFGEILEEESGGRLALELHYSASLGDQTEAALGVQSGTIDGAMLPAGVVSDYGCEQLKVFNMPYLFDSVAHARAFEKSDSGRALLDLVQKSDSRMVCIGTYQEGARSYFFTKQNVRAPEDMKDLVIRCQEGDIYRDVVEALGASARSVAFSELYSALQSGVVDGAEQPLSGFVINGYASICKYYVLDQHEISPNLILFSEASWQQLDAEEQEMIRRAFGQSVEYFEEISDRKDEEYYREIEKAGVTITKVNVRDWKAASHSVYDTYGRKFGEIIEQIKNTKY